MSYPSTHLNLTPYFSVLIIPHRSYARVRDDQSQRPAPGLGRRQFGHEDLPPERGCRQLWQGVDTELSAKFVDFAPVPEGLFPEETDLLVSRAHDGF